MKMILAMIQPERLDAVKAALEQTGAPFICGGDVLDLREQSAEMCRGLDYRAPRVSMRLEVLVVNDMLVEETVAAIAGAACAGDSGPHGKGNIFVMAVEEWIPICGCEPRFAHTLAV